MLSVNYFSQQPRKPAEGCEAGPRKASGERQLRGKTQDREPSIREKKIRSTYRAHHRVPLELSSRVIHADLKRSPYHP